MNSSKVNYITFGLGFLTCMAGSVIYLQREEVDLNPCTIPVEPGMWDPCAPDAKETLEDFLRKNNHDRTGISKGEELRRLANYVGAVGTTLTPEVEPYCDLIEDGSCYIYRQK